jgi:ABC-type multidrug transport system ATPase subunit
MTVALPERAPGTVQAEVNVPIRASAASAAAVADRVTNKGAKVVETRGLTKRYGSDIVAVENLDLSIYRGEVYGFLGPNGAGKTTTLRMLLGLIKSSSGSATVAGHASGSAESLAKVGAMIETPAFWPYLSGYENLRVLALYCNVPISRVNKVLDQVDLGPRAKHTYSTYSLGMKQRLGLAAALLKDPELLILDEPTNGLDPQGMADFRSLIVSLGRGDRTVLVSSHLLDEVEQMCTRAGVIRGGKLVAEGTIRELRGETKVTVRATPPDRAKIVLDQLLGAGKVNLNADGRFSLRVDVMLTGEINAALVQAGIVVTELGAAEKSLEDVFMELTGSEGGL